ncbi:MAG: hypothetical protein B7Z08_12380 [Sphingomonadales bacterium 32-68-7]|nr:MAG: hypothetical protein B7Z33_09105 [Sphingomonadales bacterium 12-68-11]OYX07435.1 MAG: hypothetical protein B7Z08_12380 [Sphingomonadales bacterium 32-68-7]
MVYRVLLALGAAFLCAAEAPPPPPQLEAYVKYGRFEPGDYAWIKGRFDDSTPDEKAAYEAIMRWYGACSMAARAEQRATLIAEGYPEAGLERLALAPDQCLGFGQPPVADTRSFAAFERELAAVRPVMETYLAAVGVAEEASRPGSRADLARQLEARPVGEQMLRLALNWSRGMSATSPGLTPVGQAIFMSRIGPAIAARDFANTEWLKGVIAEHGWPKISEVGQEAGMYAWLLAQHADHDPLFQRDVLRLIEPLAAQGEVRKPDFAYLYDRVMLKWAGKQRYGSQAECRDGRLQPQPLEDEAAVNRLRAEMDLGPVEDYMAMMNERSGPCQSPPGRTG